MKKMLVFALLASILMSLSLSAFAATPDQRVLDALNATNCPEVYINYYVNFMKSHTITDAEADVVIGFIEQADAIMGDKEAKDLTLEEVTGICEQWVSACEACGYEASYKIDYKKKVYLTITDEEGKTVKLTLTRDSIVQTDVDYTALYIAGGACLIAAAAAFVFIKRRVKA